MAVAHIKIDHKPSELEIVWFTKHVGPRTHYLPHSIGGIGWIFNYDYSDHMNPDYNDVGSNWILTLQDEKMLTYYLLTQK